uniref:S1 motif domain-containing protein n=1 Tax=viral metagenome TaxID=1070528 RepID=A0A6C0D1N1_9ZZZZ
MEAFPTIENILEQTNFSTFQEDIDKMSQKKQIWLKNEEYKLLERFRFGLLTFYEDHKEAITGEYTAELEKLRKEVYQMLKAYKDDILALRAKHIKTPGEPELAVGVELKPLPRRRIRPGDDIRTRIIAGDDLKRDVERLPKRFQDRIQTETDKLNELKLEEIQEAKEKRNQQRDRFWDKLSNYRRSYEERKVVIKEFDDYEETDIKTILRKYEGLVIQMRRKYIELSKIPNVDLNSPEADYNYQDGEQDQDEAGAVEPTQPKIGEKEKNLDVDNLYTESIIQEKIKISFNNVSNNMIRYFESYAQKKMERKCRNEGYIRSGSASVISYSTGLLNSDSIIYNVVYSVQVCYPYENMEIECKIKNITKIGIRAIITEHNNPIVLFISREHNPDKDFEQYKEDSYIRVKVLGHRFELNDEYISVIGELL